MRINARTGGVESSFYPICLKEWNNLTPEIRELPTVNSSKNQLFVLIRPTQKSIYGLHDGSSVVILTQPRLGLTNLNSHKFNHNFPDTVDPMCLICDVIKDIEHV